MKYAHPILTEDELEEVIYSLTACCKDELAAKLRAIPLIKRSSRIARTRAADLTGKTRGTWRVLEYVAPGPSSPVWRCRCRRGPCRFERNMSGAQLRNTPPACQGCKAAGYRYEGEGKKGRATFARTWNG